MAPSHNLTTEEDLRAYLATHSQAPVTITLLTGGTANYVYRVRNTDGSTTIFKHAAPFLRINKAFQFDQMRMDFEAHILEIISPVDGVGLLADRLPNSTVHVVRLLKYDKGEKLLAIEDGGDQNLKDAYTNSNLDVPGIARELGQWLAALHICSRETSLALSSHETNVRGNNPVGLSIYRHSYSNLHTALKKYGYDTKLAERINEDFGSLIATDDECICHGDFWPGNVLVRLNDIPDGKPADLTIVDWEMVRRGTSATDVGQFAAEAFLLDRFRGGRGLRPAFLRAYIMARESDGMQIGKTWVKRMVVHWAVHVAFWPTRVEWTDEESTRKLVDLGVAVLDDVLDGEWEKVMKSPLLEDVEDEWWPVIRRA
ncbi:kinase-like protein [Dothidotthia symphoricarpi CBS 119687]|uniref:Kinase-like protein n=1 Tax=Dothidotthia symphoricarpi CBS 119687 TaxID=1392245 RepID=A0A6A6AB12_9PLEO|nr:kinase-like protein [Dothidotthia symphoricarpi CBS 119687]KAF2128403.1 kinase-like protein [Dothidotthia symphoricarpi CBS 119687]